MKPVHRLLPFLATSLLILLGGCASGPGSSHSLVQEARAPDARPIDLASVDRQWAGYLHCQGADFWLDARVSGQGERLSVSLSGQPTRAEFPYSGNPPRYPALDLSFNGSLDSRTGSFTLRTRDRQSPWQALSGFYLPSARAWVANPQTAGLRYRQWQGCSPLLLVPMDERERIAEGLIEAPSIAGELWDRTAFGRIVNNIQLRSLRSGSCDAETEAWLKAYLQSLPPNLRDQASHEPYVARMYAEGRFEAVYGDPLMSLDITEGHSVGQMLSRPERCGIGEHQRRQQGRAISYLTMPLSNSIQLSRNKVATLNMAMDLYEHWFGRANALVDRIHGDRQTDPKRLDDTLTAIEAQAEEVRPHMGPDGSQHSLTRLAEARSIQNERIIVAQLDARLARPTTSLGALANLAAFPRSQAGRFNRLTPKARQAQQQRIDQRIARDLEAAVAGFARAQKGVAGYQALVNWQRHHAALAAQLSPAQRSRLDTRFTQRRAELVRATEQAYRQRYQARLGSLPQGPQSLKAGIAFEKEVTGILSPMTAEPALRQFARERAARRQADLSASLGQLQVALLSQQNESDLAAFRKAWLWPADQNSAPARRLLAAIEARRDIVAPFSRFPAGEYLNALYGGDFQKVRTLDKAFSKPYREGLLGQGMDQFTTLVDGLAGLAGVETNLRQRMRRSLNEMSLIVPLFASYLIGYERLGFGECLEPDHVRFKKTVRSETVYRNTFGVSHTVTHPDQITWFRVNRRFAPVFHEVGLSNPDSFLGNLVDNLYGQKGRTNVSEVVNGVRRIMSRMDCKSPTIRKLENNMIRYFADYQRRTGG